jgi:hypothetical protein
VQGELSEAFKIPEEKVRVIVPDTGSAYCGKHTGDAAIEAARLAKAIGQPVRVVWTRQEEFEWAYFRPAGVIEVRAGARADGTSRHGISQLNPAARPSARLMKLRISVSSFIEPTRRYARVPIAGWPPMPIASRARRTWTNWRAP